MTPYIATILLWSAWVVSWWVAAFWSDPAAKRAGVGAEWLYRVLTIAGALLMFAGYSRSFYARFELWTVTAVTAWCTVAVVALGLLFTWWARIYLGKLWSSSVTRKTDHHVVDTGPYAIVRHPIYTGILAAAFATAFLKGTSTAMAGAVVMTWGFWIKARLEERFLREELGSAAYDSYRRRVPMLVPFGPKSP